MSIEDSNTGLMKEQLLCPRVWLLQHLVNLKISIFTDKMSWFKNKTTKKMRCVFFFFVLSSIFYALHSKWYW